MNIALYKSVNTPEMEESAIKVMRSGKISSGEYVGKFEAALGRMIGSHNVVSTVDMTSAMFLALHLAGVEEGDEVLTLSFCCLSSTAAIAQKRARPVWVDVRPGTVEMDIVDLKSKISSKTKAVIIYHIAGYPGPVKEISSICKENGIFLIEDCNSSLFATLDSLPVGGFGDFAVYSFYPNRQINTIEGGALICKKSELADKARLLRRFGINTSTFRRADGEINIFSDIPEIGWSITLNNLCASLGYAQLGSLLERQKIVEENVLELKNLILNVDGIREVPVLKGATSAYWVFLIFSDNYDSFINEMKRQGVTVSGLHTRNDRYSGFGVEQPTVLDNTEYLQEHLIGIPCGWWLGKKEILYIAAAIKQAALVACKSRSDSLL